jgi:hypothetical protein
MNRLMSGPDCGKKKLMGAYTEYLEKRFNFGQLQQERKRQLESIAKLRGGRDVLVYAADLSKNIPGVTIDYSDILPVQDQLTNLSAEAIDIIIETPGGFAEAAEDIIRIIRGKYERVGMIVPGWAKSAGTILVMAGDEILMGTTSALGPIDAQIRHQNKGYSAHAFLEGLEQIKREVSNSGKLNPAYIPILQNISPGEIQHCLNAQKFSETLVAEWLEKYKFKYWTTRQTSGEAVPPEMKRRRAAEIAQKLGNQSKWLTHGRSIRIEDLEKDLNLRITDYSKLPELSEAITRYYTLLRMTFETNVFKIFETTKSQIYRFTGIEAVKAPPPKQKVQSAQIDLRCPKCQQQLKIQANFQKGVPLAAGCLPYPLDNDLIKCPNCGTEQNIANIRLQLEGESGRKLVKE